MYKVVKNHIFLSVKTIIFSYVFMLPVLSVAEEQQHFDIWEYQIEGNSLLEPENIESTLYPYLGANKTLETVEQARELLQNSYKSEGYPIVVVSIPQQNVIGGKVRLVVVEGEIDRLKISGNKYFSRRELRKELPSLESGQPLNMKLARKEIDIANEASPHRSIVPVIRPGRKRGTMEMELKVHDELPLTGSVELNNRYTTDTTPLRLMTSIEYGHLWQKHHSFSAGYQVSPQDLDEVEVLNLSYALPVSESSRLVFYAIDSGSEVATVTGGGDSLTVLGNGKIYGLRTIHTLPTAGNYFHRMLLGLAYKDFTEDQNIENDTSGSGVNVPIDYAAWSISYNGTIRDEYISQFSIAANFGLRAFNEAEDFEFKRFQAKENYFYLNGRFSQVWNLNSDINVLYYLGGQYTESPLISNEQYSAGGMDTVRGYTESSAQGDNGLSASVEMTYRLLESTDDFYNQLGLSLFVDAANLHILEALPDIDGEKLNRHKLLGAGMGLSFTAYKDMQLRFYYAKPLKDLLVDDFDDAARVHFSLSYQFK